MTEKAEIVRQLGEQALLLPALLSDALAANDRLKLRLSLLQDAAAHARDPERPLRTFDRERQAAGLSDPGFDRIITGAHLLAGEHILAPGAKLLIDGIKPDLVAMLAPLKVAGSRDCGAFEKRLTALAADIPAAKNDELVLHEIQALTSARGSDSVHLLIMDVHKAINRLAAETAVESIDGARVHHIEERDRPRIRAFMAGINRTAPLAFGHPGLGTTAARSGARLTIQNDIGTTDAHVLVIHVDDMGVSITYTDVHRARAKFFVSLCSGEGIEWSPLDQRSARDLGEDDAFYLVSGRLAASDEAQLQRILEFLGARIVFLIDWNKARKSLQTFVAKKSAVAILHWAAVHEFGHRAFLELGGPELVFEAVRRVASGRIPYGARLDGTLGASDAEEFLKRIMRLTSEGLRAGRSARLMRDEIQADLAQLFDTAEFGVLAVLLRHLGITRMLAAAVADAFAQGAPDTSRLAVAAKTMEEKADRLTVEAREICARMQNAGSLRIMVDAVENATDALDECAFLFSLTPRDNAAASLEVLAELANITIESISQLVRATEAASLLPQGHRLDAADSLRAIDAVVVAERLADTAERNAFAALAHAPAADSRSLVFGLEVARALETATDHLAHAALSLRDRVLEELSA
ncbi:MAG TPA: hypothetical protein VMD53_12190 [Rhizomicrobium sp.]|nr:hypothetical protein [Rhizomicrobium sp.]